MIVFSDAQMGVVESCDWAVTILFRCAVCVCVWWRRGGCARSKSGKVSRGKWEDTATMNSFAFAFSSAEKR